MSPINTTTAPFDKDSEEPRGSPRKPALTPQPSDTDGWVSSATVRDPADDAADEQSQTRSTLYAIEEAAGYTTRVDTTIPESSKSSSTQSFATAKSSPVRTETGAPSPTTPKSRYTSAQDTPNEPAEVHYYTAAEIQRFNTLGREKLDRRVAAKKKAKEEEISDMEAWLDDEFDKQFEKIDVGGYGASDHNGTKRKWYRGYRR